MKTIFRIEDAKTGIGMYHSGKAQFFMNEGDYDNHPAPSRDSLLVQNINVFKKRDGYASASDFKYGFDSIKQMRRWLYEDRWLKQLDTNGLKLAEIDVDESNLIVGHTQVMFRNEVSKRHYKINEYFNQDK